MKANPYRTVAVLVLSCWALMAQNSIVNRSDVQVLAQNAVKALRANNARFFSELVDPAGIVVGVDEPLMSASQFRKELTAKTGVFCVLFDDQHCSRGFVKSSTSSSLHQLVTRERVAIRITEQEMSKGSRVISAVVSGYHNPNEILFTLYFRSTGEHWVLANIDYE